MKPVAQLQIDLPWIGIMRSAKGQAIVEQESAICDVQPGNGKRKAFTKRFADGKIESSVTLQMARVIQRAVRET